MLSDPCRNANSRDFLAPALSNRTPDQLPYKPKHRNTSKPAGTICKVGATCRKISFALQWPAARDWGRCRRHRGVAKPRGRPEKIGWRRPHGEYVSECDCGPALCRTDRPLSLGQNEPVGGAAVRERDDDPPRQRARRQFGRRLLARGAGAVRCRPRSMSPATSFLGDPWTILDCPGSVELAYEAQSAMLAADVAVVVVEPEVERALTISPLLRFLDQPQIPHMIFINKMDTASARVRDVLAALQSVSQRPLVLRQVPLRGGEGEITGYVDLVSERAYSYRPGQPSDLIPLPDDFLGRGAGHPHRPDREARRFRRRAARKAARRNRAVEGGDLSAPDPRDEPGADRAGVSRLGDCRSRRAPPVEGVAPRDTVAAGNRGAARHRRRGRAVGAGRQDLSPAAYRQVVVGADVARDGQ